MIRTRDFILYLCVLMFVILGAVYTGVTSRVSDSVSLFVFSGSDDAPPALEVIDPSEPYDRAGRVAELRQKIAAGGGEVSGSAPASDTFVDEPASPSDEVLLVDAPTATSSAIARVVQYCGGVAAPYVSSGQRIDAVKNEGSMRVLYRENAAQPPVSTTSTSSVTVSLQKIGELPLRTARSASNTCLPDILIGVYQAGSSWFPLTNAQARAFGAYQSNQLIGYSRDGFGIYGAMSDESALDACGGQVVSGVYQYHLRSDDLFILGCYAHAPVPLNI